MKTENGRGIRRLTLVIALLTLLVGVALVGPGPVFVSAQPNLFINPTPVARTTAAFSISVDVDNFAHLTSYVINVQYNPTVLDATTATFIGTEFDRQCVSPCIEFALRQEVDVVPGLIGFDVSYLGGEFNGGGSLLIINFNAPLNPDGTSPFDLFNTVLVDTSFQEIPHGEIDGAYNPPSIVHDVAVTAVSASSLSIIRPPDTTVTITVDVANQGTETETFTVTALAGPVTIGTQAVSDLPAGGTQVLIFSLNTASLPNGGHLISATATTVTGETDTADNSKDDGTLVISPEPVHDVAVTAVSASPLSVTRPPDVTVTIIVDLANQGNQPETFTVTASAGGTTLPSQSVSLGVGGTQTLTFSLNTAFLADGSYLIRATASIVVGEIDTADNTVDDGNLLVTTTTEPVHDVAVTGVSASQLTVVRPPDATITITVDVANQGTEIETFTVAALAGSTTIDTQTVPNLAAGGTQTLTFILNTVSLADGSHVIRAIASTVTGETDTSDNSMDDGTLLISPIIHDLAVTDVRPTKTSVIAGETITVSVTVKNNGNVEESSITVRALYGTTEIGSLPGGPIAPLASATFEIPWNTAGVSAGAYLMKGSVDPVTDEENILDNLLSDGQVTVIIFDFDLSLSSTSASLPQGASVSIDVSLTLTGGTTEPVILAASGEPSGVTILFNPSTGSPGFTSVMTMSAAVTTAIGSSTITVTATSTSGLTERATFSLTVTEAVHDVAVEAVSAPGLATTGDDVTVNATIANNGSVSETVTVRLLVNGNQVAELAGITVDSGSSHLVSLVWDTEGYAALTYQVQVAIAPVEGETATSDNVFDGGSLVLQAGALSPPPRAGPLASDLSLGLITLAIVVLLSVFAFFFVRKRKTSHQV